MVKITQTQFLIAIVITVAFGLFLGNSLPFMALDKSETTTVTASVAASPVMADGVPVLPGLKYNRYCVGGTVWIRTIFEGQLAGQQLDLNGKPIPCVEKK